MSKNLMHKYSMDAEDQGASRVELLTYYCPRCYSVTKIKSASTMFRAEVEDKDFDTALVMTCPDDYASQVLDSTLWVICRKCGKISKEVKAFKSLSNKRLIYDSMIQVDTDIVETVILFNKAGYKTIASCAGHVAGHFKQKGSDEPYIGFTNIPKTKLDHLTALIKQSIENYSGNIEIELKLDVFRYNGEIRSYYHIFPKDISLLKKPEIMKKELPHMRDILHRAAKALKEKK